MIEVYGGGGPVVAVLDSTGGLHLFNRDGLEFAGANPVWSAPAAPTFGLSTAGLALVVAAGDSVYFLEIDGTETARVGVGGEVVRRPVGFRWEGARRALVEVEGGLLVEVSTAGIEDSWQLDGSASLLLSKSDRISLVAVQERLYRIERDGSGELELIWSGTSEIVDGAGFIPMHPVGAAAGVALLEASGRLTLLNVSPDLDVAREYCSYILTGVTGRVAIAYLRGAGWPPSVVVPTAGGIFAAEANGPVTAGWPPSGRGRAAIDPPRVIGTPLSIADGAVAGLTSEGELVVYGPTAAILPGGLRKLLNEPYGPVCLGDGGNDRGPFLVYTDRDSLRVVSLGVYGLEWRGSIWSGPDGGSAGGGWGIHPSGWLTMQTEGLTDIYLYPNPASRSCRIRAGGFDGLLSVKGFTQSGTHLGEVARLEGSGPGVYEAEWDVSGLAPGVYFLVAELLEQPGGRIIERRRLNLLVVREER
jgi:hypothetical protein